MSSWNSNSNLPPGVNTNMIPGNRPEDLDDEKFWDQLIDKAPSDKLPEEWYDDEGLIDLVYAVRELSYSQGYNDGANDTALEISSKMKIAE